MTAQNITVYVCQHKEYPMLDSECVTNIHAGKAISKKQLGIIGDDTGDSISERNASFCELTVLYWIWKNSKDNIVGLMHYRRFFNFGRRRIFYLPKKHPESCKITYQNLSRIFEEFDVVLPEKNSIRPNIRTQYSEYHYIEDLDLCLDIIEKEFPDMYDTAKETLNANKAHLYNMLIARKDIFDEYCHFLFTVLFKVEKTISKKLEKRDKYNQRVFGFLAERLLNIFFNYKQAAHGEQLHIKEVPVSLYFPTGLRGYIDFKSHTPKKIKRLG